MSLNPNPIAAWPWAEVDYAKGGQDLDEAHVISLFSDSQNQDLARRVRMGEYFKAGGELFFTASALGLASELALYLAALQNVDWGTSRLVFFSSVVSAALGSGFS